LTESNTITHRAATSQEMTLTLGERGRLAEAHYSDMNEKQDVYRQAGETGTDEEGGRDQGSFCEDWFFSPVGESCFGPARRGDLLGTSRSCKKSQKVVLPIPPPKQILGGF
jgi:hypothetical protein